MARLSFWEDDRRAAEAKVRRMYGQGVPMSQICLSLGCSEPTLRKLMREMRLIPSSEIPGTRGGKRRGGAWHRPAKAGDDEPRGFVEPETPISQARFLFGKHFEFKRGLYLMDGKPVTFNELMRMIEARRKRHGMEPYSRNPEWLG